MAGKITAAEALAEKCHLCLPRACGVDRLKNQTGFCRAPGTMIISSVFPHHGEEPPLSGKNGSGTIFFSHCTLRCLFCQNFQISHEAEGRPYSEEELSAGLIDLQNKGCHNINLVTPSHFLPWILKSLHTASKKGLAIPIVYNCGGYETFETIAILNNIVDIFSAGHEIRLAGTRPKTFQRAGLCGNQPDGHQGHVQTGPQLQCDVNNIAYRGLCIRHLVLPHGLADSYGILRFLKNTFDPADIFISLMAQYYPAYKAVQIPELSRRISAEEYEPLKQAFVDAGFNGFFQELQDDKLPFKIDFKKRKNQALTGE